MSRALLIHPGPDWSVHDVYNGWKKGLLANGVDVCEYPTNSRLQFFSQIHLKRPDGFEPAMTSGDVCHYAMQAIREFCYVWWPDIVVVISGFWWDKELAHLVKMRGHKVIHVMTESPYQDDQQIQTAYAGCDLVVLNDPTNIQYYEAAGLNTLYLPHSYDPDLHRPGPSVPELESDVAIVGTGYPSRVETLTGVDWSGIDLALGGMWRGIDRDHLLAEHVRTPDGGRALDDPDPEWWAEQCVDNDQTVRWYNSTQASVNMYRREANHPELEAGWSMGPREVELAATGTFFVTEPRGENIEVFPSIPKFVGAGELEDVLRWYLDRPDARADAIDAARAAVGGWTFRERVAEALRVLDRQSASVG